MSLLNTVRQILQNHSIWVRLSYNILFISHLYLDSNSYTGHLRSAIIGNFLSNLLNVTNNRVTRMNYLGDYGTQFGFLRVGIEMENLSDDEIRRNPLQSLFRAYVTANTSTDPKIAERARRVFEMMEKDENEEIVKQWEMIKSYTMDELRTMYERLNIVFDVFEFESMYRKRETENVISMLRDKQLLHNEIDGKISVSVGERRVPIVKSDSTTLYLTRDVAAVLSRLKKYQMSKIYYVVDNGQNDHFVALKTIIKNLGFDENLVHHIKFGTIKGMSTRKGSVVFLKDILDEARDLMFKKQQETSTTKVDLSKCGEEIADILGSSAVIINDLKQSRTRHYDFDWNKVLQVNGDTGIKFQYTHCRLHSLELNCNFEAAKEIEIDLLDEPEAQQLIYEIIRYPEVILYCSESLESSGLVTYLFTLCNTTSKALKTLPVIQCQDQAIAQQRLLLFNSARKVLKHGLEILGLKVLNKM